MTKVFNVISQNYSIIKTKKENKIIKLIEHLLRKKKNFKLKL